MAERWADEYDSEMHRGEADREQTVRGHIRRIAEFMENRGLVIETMVRDQVKALQASVTRTPVNPPAVAVPDALAPEDLVTMQQAVQLPGMASKAPLKRRIGAGALVPAEAPATAYRYRIGDLYSEACWAPREACAAARSGRAACPRTWPPSWSPRGSEGAVHLVVSEWCVAEESADGGTTGRSGSPSARLVTARQTSRRDSGAGLVS
jgi:hypothetical protein